MPRPISYSATLIPELRVCWQASAPNLTTGCSLGHHANQRSCSGMRGHARLPAAYLKGVLNGIRRDHRSFINPSRRLAADGPVDRWHGTRRCPWPAAACGSNHQHNKGPPARAPATLSGIEAVIRKPRYAGSIWSILVADATTGEVLYEIAADRMALAGSVRKLFSVGLALEQPGADHRFMTPVYRQGAVDATGTLIGDLILVAAGDLTLGGRQNADGTIAFTNFDHNDANNPGTAILTPEGSLHGLDTLARQVRASGIQAATGEIMVDDRLFTSFRVPNEPLLITPIMVNDNMIDVTVTPTAAGQPAAVDWRPQTEAFGVHAGVTTVPVGSDTTVSLSDGGRAECIGEAGCVGTVEGEIPVGYRAPLTETGSLVQTFRTEEPASFADRVHRGPGAGRGQRRRDAGGAESGGQTADAGCVSTGRAGRPVRVVPVLRVCQAHSQSEPQPWREPELDALWPRSWAANDHRCARQ